MKTHRTVVAILTAAFCVAASADASLEACSKKKTRQMELLERRHPAPGRGRKQAKRSAADIRQQVEKIDQWLWKNCRSHAEEMRTIEQQYM